ncbi:glucosamine-6-phosphate deaminase [Segetibacter koreensis]|uniref:glucosamine-6-phosphate deaminase n=1 Tax=Segetibacter koreensis TaxID=398037 RepID=UPI00035EC9DE|nr:glucosamine-6-phosphate deaminase [Segetibacter koreensis]
MELFVADTYEAMSKQAAEDVLQLMQPAEKALICPASGDSPAGLYKELVQLVKTKQVNISDWSFVGLDEWAGMNGVDEGSCRFHLNNQLFNPLEIKSEKICFFDGRASDLQFQCNQVEDFIAAHQGIDVAIVGLGLNGHVGMNEPGTSASLRSHVTDIDPLTQKTGQKYFKEPRSLTQGITLGLANLMETKHVILLVSGRHKADIVKQILEGEISEALPASLLRNHQNLKVYLDKEAAALLHL